MSTAVEVEAASESPATLNRWLSAAVIAVVCLLPVVYSTSLYHSLFAPKFAGLLVLGGLGLPLLASRAIPGLERGLAVAFLAVAGLSLAVNDQPLLSLWGHENWGNGWLFLAAGVGTWALCRHLSAASRVHLGRGLLAAVGVNLVGAVVETLVDTTRWGLPLVSGRPIGLLGNPVHLGALLAAGVALSRGLVTNLAARSGIAAALALGVGLSGSRAALALLVVVVVWVAWRERAVAAALLVVALGVGIAASLAVAEVGKTDTIASRAVDGGATDPGERFHAWRSAVPAVLDRPVLGRGPGRFLEATSPHRSRAYGQQAPDVYFADAHNLPIELAVTTGLAGFLLAAGWLVAVLRKARGAFAAFALVLLAYFLLEPQTPGLTPLLFAALGAAGPAPDDVERRRLVLPAAAVGGLAGAAAGVMLLAGSFYARQTILDFERQDAVRALRYLPPWPEAAEIRGRPAVFVAPSGNQAAVAAARQWFREGVSRGPDDPRAWVRKADYDLLNERVDDAEAAYRELLELDPWSLRARRGLTVVAARRGELAEARRLTVAILATWPDDRRAQNTLEAIDDLLRERQTGAGPEDPAPAGAAATGLPDD